MSQTRSSVRGRHVYHLNGCEDGYFLNPKDQCELDCTQYTGVTACSACNPNNLAKCDDTLQFPCMVQNAVLSKKNKGCECGSGFTEENGQCTDGSGGPTAPPTNPPNGNCEDYQYLDPTTQACEDLCTYTYGYGEDYQKCSICQFPSQNKCAGCVDSNAVPNANGRGCKCPDNHIAVNGICVGTCTTLYQADTEVSTCATCMPGNQGDMCASCVDPFAVVKVDKRGCECPPYYSIVAGVCFKNTVY